MGGVVLPLVRSSPPGSQMNLPAPATLPWSPGEKRLPFHTLMVGFITGHHGTHAGFTNLTTPPQTWARINWIGGGACFPEFWGS